MLNLDFLLLYNPAAAGLRLQTRDFAPPRIEQILRIWLRDETDTISNFIIGILHVNKSQ